MNEQQLLDAIWQPAIPVRDCDIAGVETYRRNLLANATRALSISFPTIFQLVDSDIGSQISAHFLTVVAPNKGDWAQWGQELPVVLAEHSLIEHYPYLPDCAALDWKVHRAMHGFDDNVEQATLARLADTDPQNITIEFNRNVSIVDSEFPIVDIFEAHHHDDTKQRDKAMKRATQKLQQTSSSASVLVYRPQYQPKVKTLSIANAIFIKHLLGGASLAAALNAVANYPHFSFEQWLIKAIEQNLILRLKETKT